MCTCQHKIHWSVVALIVNIVAIVCFTTGLVTHNWAIKSEGIYSVTTGLFLACSELNSTCYDTHVYFNSYTYEKNLLVASAVMNMFSLIGFFIFFALSIFFLCGLYEEKQIATGAVVTAYVSGICAVIGTITYAVTIKRLSFSLSWSFILAVFGFIINFASGVLMCVGRNISTGSRKNKTKKPTDPETDELPMADTDRKSIWHTSGSHKST